MEFTGTVTGIKFRNEENGWTVLRIKGDDGEELTAVGVMPSVNEGFCCVNVEANACGVPFMAVKGLPMDEVLANEDYDRWLFVPRDVEGLARMIIDFARCRYEQNLVVDLDANHLVRQFCDWIKEKRRGL